MNPLTQPPLIPGLGVNQGPNGGGQRAYTRSPFFTVSNQFLPRNLHDVIRWVRFIAANSPVTTEVLRKLATYPITTFIVDTKSPAEKAKYQEIIKSFRLKTSLHDIGLQYYTIGNVFISVYFPFIRTYTCSNQACKSTFHGETTDFLKFHNYGMRGTCPKCATTGIFTRKEIKSTNVADMNLISWDPMNIAVNHNPISGKSIYFYRIPNELKRKIESGDKMTLDSTPWEFIEAVKDKKDFEFSKDHLFHLKNIDMGSSVEGIAVPPLVSHFSLVFYQATLRRANESIATDFMAPMRVIFPQAQSANSDPVVSLSMRNFVSKMEEAISRHKTDNNHVLIAPVPVGYQAVSGEGKALLVSQEIAQAEDSLLLSMGVSRELLSGMTNWTSSTVGLRMLKNTLDGYVDQVEELMDWIFSKTSSYLSVPNRKVTLSPFQLTDDENLKAILLNLSTTGSVSMTTVYESMGRSYEDELQRIEEDSVRKAQHDIRVKHAVEQGQYLEAIRLGKVDLENDTFKGDLAQAQEITEQLLQAPPAQVRSVLNQLRLENHAKFLMVSKLLEDARRELTRQATDEENAAVRNQETGQGPVAGGSGGPPELSSNPVSEKM